MFQKYLYIMLISMVPLIELRGAIPVATAMGLSSVPTYFISVACNLIPVPFILLFINAILNWMETVRGLKKVALWLKNKASVKKERVDRYAAFGLFVFTALPIPGTGAWMAALIAALFHMNRKRAILSISAGVATAGIIMILACTVLSDVLGFLV